MQENKKCLFCGKEFGINKYNTFNHVFCSHSCNHKYNTRKNNPLFGVEKTCIVCRKKYIPRIGYEKISKFCCEYCKNKQAAIVHINKYGIENINKEQRDNRAKRMLDPEYSRKIKEYSRTPEKRFSQYIKGANTRNIIFNLSYEQFLSFFNKPCHYCGDKINGVGIDRVDNSRGYEINNCVPCCETCNRMKLKLSLSDFFSHIKQIYKHSKLNKLD